MTNSLRLPGSPRESANPPIDLSGPPDGATLTHPTREVEMGPLSVAARRRVLWMPNSYLSRNISK